MPGPWSARVPALSGGWCNVRRVRVEGVSEERAYGRPFDPEVAARILNALGVEGCVKVMQCWVDSTSCTPRRQAVLVRMRERWCVGGEDTGVPVERVFYLRHEGGEWYLDGGCRVMPNELDEVFDRGPALKGKTCLGLFADQVHEEAVASAGIGCGVVREYSVGSPEWHGMHVDRRRSA